MIYPPKPPWSPNAYGKAAVPIHMYRTVGWAGTWNHRAGRQFNWWEHHYADLIGVAAYFKRIYANAPVSAMANRGNPFLKNVTKATGAGQAPSASVPVRRPRARAGRAA